MGAEGRDGLTRRLEAAGMDVQGTLRRFCGNEALYLRFLLKFLEDQTFEQIGPALDAADDGLAFQLVHTLKGVAGNLGLTWLYQASIATTECLRAGDHAGAVAAYQELKRAYSEAAALLREGGGPE